MAIILIGIDDTDNETSPGTGQLARRLAQQCEKRGLKSMGITRHQFLLDPAIPYTSHNSGACIVLNGVSGIEEVFFVIDFVAESSAEGSDPGVCIALADKVPGSVMEFGNAAMRKVLKIEDAFSLAKSVSVNLYGLGGNCQGVIGALASVGLYAEGQQGRFIDLPGLRELEDCVNAHSYDKMGIGIQYKANGRNPKQDDRYDTLGWVRPRLVGGKPVLKVEWSEEKNAWIPVDRKKSRSLE